MKKYPLILPVALLALAMALTACGGGSSSSGGGEEAAIEEAIETSATSSDPSKCSEVQTQAFNEAETEKKGEAALEACEKEVEAESEPAESVAVSNISENGDTATAEVAITGGSLEGQAVELELANEDGNWKLNEFHGFTKYDPAGLGAFMEEKLSEEEGITPELAKCVAEGVEEMSKKEAEEFVFEKNVEVIEESASACNK